MSRMVKLIDVLDILNFALESYEDSLEYCEADLAVALREGIREDINALGVNRERVNACITELRDLIAEVKAL